MKRIFSSHFLLIQGKNGFKLKGGGINDAMAMFELWLHFWRRHSTLPMSILQAGLYVQRCDLLCS